MTKKENFIPDLNPITVGTKIQKMSEKVFNTFYEQFKKELEGEKGLNSKIKRTYKFTTSS